MKRRDNLDLPARTKHVDSFGVVPDANLDENGSR
jgi:hypothetical protein